MNPTPKPKYPLNPWIRSDVESELPASAPVVVESVGGGRAWVEIRRFAPPWDQWNGREPEPEPTEAPEPEPTKAPEPEPTKAPEPEPTEAPEPEPTEAPEPEPTEAPEPEPTEAPEPEPTEAPEPEPTEAPEPEPTEAPEPEPTEAPEPKPTEGPEPEPTEAPELEPTEAPEPEPTEGPEPEPTEAPEPEPTIAPIQPAPPRPAPIQPAPPRPAPIQPAPPRPEPANPMPVRPDPVKPSGGLPGWMWGLMVILGLIVLAQMWLMPKGHRDAGQQESSESPQSAPVASSSAVARQPDKAETSSPGQESASVVGTPVAGERRMETTGKKETTPPVERRTETTGEKETAPPVERRTETTGEKETAPPVERRTETTGEKETAPPVERRTETTNVKEAPLATAGAPASVVLPDGGATSLQGGVKADGVGDGPRVEPTTPREQLALRGAPKQLKPKLKPKAKRMARKDGARRDMSLSFGIRSEESLSGGEADAGIERPAPAKTARQAEATPSGSAPAKTARQAEATPSGSAPAKTARQAEATPSGSASQARAASLFGMPSDPSGSGADSASNRSGAKVEFVVAYGCFSNGGEIRRRQEAIRARGWPVRNSYYTVGQTIMTCLYSGPFPTPQTADKATDLFEEKGCLQLPKEEQPTSGH
ncbi:hypothetical protein SIID45300_02998 [Candidatus Magnetaquicoccaceae bacterium FCR-1]|uniref:SPOR domain-containing protein n=1 Tax=Candidatus Magnetaquiglobus chichijimensis TaxID=3141448 RepID=A0ABQ0CCR5_9PROT